MLPSTFEYRTAKVPDPVLATKTLSALEFAKVNVDPSGTPAFV